MKILRSLIYLKRLPRPVHQRRQLQILLCNKNDPNEWNEKRIKETAGIFHSMNGINFSSISIDKESFITSNEIKNQQNNDVDNDEKNPSSKRKSQLEIIIKKLNIFYRMNGFIGNEQLQPLLDYIERNNSNDSNNNRREEEEKEYFNKEQQLLLLQLIGSEMPTISPMERIENFQKLWKYFEKIVNNQNLSPEHYHVMLEVLRRNRLPLNDYRSILSRYKDAQGEGNNNNNNHNIYIKLLEVCGECGDVSLATQLLAEMRELQMIMDEHIFNTLLLAHGRQKDRDGVRNVYEMMLATGVRMGIETQTTLALLAMENHDEEVLNDILLRYHDQFRIVDVLRLLENIPNIQSTGNNDPVWLQQLLETLIKELPRDYLQQIEIPFELRRICMEMLQNDQWNLLMHLLDLLPAPVFRDNQDVDTYGIFLLHAMFRMNCGIERILEWTQRLLESGKNGRALHVLAEIALRRNPPMCLPIFQALKQRGEMLRQQYFWPLMMYNFRRHHEPGILKTLKLMKEFEVECDTMTLNDYVLGKLPIILSNPTLALKQLNDVGLKTTNILLPCILHLLKQNKWLDTLGLLRNCQQLEYISLPIEEFRWPLHNLVIHVRATKRYRQFAEFVHLLMQNRPQVDKNDDFLGSFLIELLKRQGKRFGLEANDDLHHLQEMLNEFRKYPELRISWKAYKIICEQLQNPLEGTTTNNNDNQRRIEEKLKEFVDNRLQLKSHSNIMNENEMNVIMTLETLELDEKNSTTSSSFIKHPRDMNIEELECHLIELEAKGMNTRGVLRRLLQLCVRDDGKLTRALEIKEKCDQLNVHQSPGMLASIVELYVKHKDLKNAEIHLEKLQKTYPGFLIDEHKFIDYASLLIENDQLEKSKEILEQRSKSMNQKIIGGNYLVKNIWNLLSNVSQYSMRMEKISNTSIVTKERNLTMEMFEFLKQLRYCKVQNAVLGPIIRERLLRKNLPAAIQDFQRIAHEYKHTPLQYELLTLLVRLSNTNNNKDNQETLDDYHVKDLDEAQELLKNVTDCIRKVHGPWNMNSGLLLAFAETGTDKQLRRLLLNPGFRFNEELLLKNCEHLCDGDGEGEGVGGVGGGEEDGGRERRDATRILLRLAQAMRGINRGLMDEQRIYRILFNNLVKRNDCDGALRLYRHLMQEEEEEINVGQDILKMLIDLLRSNNLQIPSDLAVKARFQLKKTGYQ